jgi:rod shape-determining protein MreC
MTKIQSRTVLAGILLLVSLGLFGLNQAGALDPVKRDLLVPLTALQRGATRLWGNVNSFFQRDPDVEALRQRNAELEAQLAQQQDRITALEERQVDYDYLASLVHYAGDHADREYLAANVIGFDPSPFLGYIILDRGSNDGVQRDMPVVTELGLVGRVVEVTSVACRVLLITDPNAPVNARLQRSRDVGVVVGGVAGGLEMQYLAQKADVLPGDVVITSGLGGAYPDGIVIGTVTVVKRQDYEVQQSAELVSPVDFRSLEMVLIITNFTPIDFTPFESATPTPN